MKQVFRHLKRLDLFCVLGAVVFIAAQVWLDLKLPDYMTEIALLVRTPGGELGRIWAAGGKMLVCALSSLAAAVIAALFTAKLAAHFGASLREALFEKVLSLSTAEVNRFSTSGLITRTTGDVTQVQMLIALGLQASFKAPITAVWAIQKVRRGPSAQPRRRQFYRCARGSARPWSFPASNSSGSRPTNSTA